MQSQQIILKMSSSSPNAARRRLRHWSMASSITFGCSPAQTSNSRSLINSFTSFTFSGRRDLASLRKSCNLLRSGLFGGHRSDEMNASRAYQHLKQAYCAKTTDEQLFSKIVSDCNNVLHTLLPPLATASQHYNLRRRTHTYSLPGHDSYLCDCNRMLYKDSY